MEKPRYIREAEQIVRLYDGIVCENDGFFEHMEGIGSVEQRDVEESARRKMVNMENALQHLSNDFYYSVPGEDGAVRVDIVAEGAAEPLTLIVNQDLLGVFRSMIDSQWEYSNFFVQGIFE